MTVLRSRFFLLCFRLREGVCRVSSLGFGVSICGSAFPGKQCRQLPGRPPRRSGEYVGVLGFLLTGLVLFNRAHTSSVSCSKLERTSSAALPFPGSSVDKYEDGLPDTQENMLGCWGFLLTGVVLSISFGFWDDC